MADIEKTRIQNPATVANESEIGSHQDNDHKAVHHPLRVLSTPAQNQNTIVPVTADSEIHANFELSNVTTITAIGQHVLLQFEKGGTITLKNLASFADSDQPLIITFQDGSALSAGQLLSYALSPENKTEPAAGEPGYDSGGIGEYEDNPGAILEGVERLDALGLEPFTTGSQSLVHTPYARLQSGAGNSEIYITLDRNITSDDNINRLEVDQMIAITGIVGGDVREGDMVTLTVNGNAYCGPVSDGRFNIPVPGSDLVDDPDNEIEASATVIDSNGHTVTVSDTETYTVFDVPEAENDTFITTENTPISGDLSNNDSPGDGDNVWALGSDPSHGSMTVTPDGSFTYTPDPNHPGTDQFTYTITDATGDTGTATVDIGIIEVKSLPDTLSTTAGGGTLPLNVESGDRTDWLTPDRDVPPLGYDIGGEQALTGDEGNDILVGGDENDLIIGALGNDPLTGGHGRDSSAFSANGGDGNDAVLDIDAATDVIRLSDVINVAADSDNDLDDLLQPGGQDVPVSAGNGDIGPSTGHGSATTVVPLTEINAGHAVDMDTTLSDLINHGSKVDPL
jgi:Ca2+-binding RTX toxin-like protein